MSDHREDFLQTIRDERDAQIRKWGDRPMRLLRNERLILSSADNLCQVLGIPTEDEAKARCDEPQIDAIDVLLEEAVEAFAALHAYQRGETGSEPAVKELTQVAAVCSKIVETIRIYEGSGSKG